MNYFGFCPTPGAMNRATTPTYMPYYFVKAHQDMFGARAVQRLEPRKLQLLCSFL